MWLLDTNACIALLNDSSAPLAVRLREVGPADVRLCSVVKAELLYGARKSEQEAANTRLLERFFAPFASLPFDDDAAVAYAGIRDRLQRAGTPIGPYDMMIAAIAIANDAVLVTGNTDEFERVVGLQLEDWSAA